jgi:6-phospho-beta-glucosidase
MKIAVIGGGGVRTPLLTSGLVRSGLPIDEIALFDVDRERLAAVAPVAREFASCVRMYDDVERSVTGAEFVVLSIRAGGIDGRARDEAIAVDHGVVGQETVGPAGFAMAMRNVPPAIEYARLIAAAAPAAWIVNFTNPVGIVTQAMTAVSGARAIGICDTPTELCEATAHALGLDSARCHFDYFGLNHLGWLREVYCDGEPRLARVWSGAGLLDRIYRLPLFDDAFLRTLRLLPTEYVFYYYRPAAALANERAAALTRGRAIAALNDALFRELAATGVDRKAAYERYLHARNASYMQIEAGAERPLDTPPPWAAVTGYDRIAVDVIRAVHDRSNAILPLNVPNCGSIPVLDDSDVVEVPCVVNGNGAHPLAVGPVPESVCDLLVRVKEYERLTIDAAASGTTDDAVRALARNPLVADEALAARLVAALQSHW